MSKFKIEITSVPDREKLVAEIWFEENLIAEINTERDCVELELYPSQGLILELNEFIKALEIAKNKLIGYDVSR